MITLPKQSLEPSAPIDLLILTNGPGEVATWVRPVVKAIRKTLGEDRTTVRISVVLSPCPHSSGNEVRVLNGYPEVDRVQDSEKFFDFLLWGKTDWDWHKKGVVIFLGGDQFFSLVISKRLGYRNVTYAEWDVRWASMLNCFAARNDRVKEQVSSKHKNKVEVIGDLMLDLEHSPKEYDSKSSLIGLMVGSKAAKLAIGVPFCLSIADALNQLSPQTNFFIPLAPTIDSSLIERYANPISNPLIGQIDGSGAKLISGEDPYLETDRGLKIKLYFSFPAHEILSQCSLVVTTVGANTAEIAALGIPMLVLLPTQQIDVMRLWEGIPGILCRLPIVGTSFATLINRWLLKQNRLYAWPNIWAKEEIVPEKIGLISPKEIAKEIFGYLQNPEELEKIQFKLQAVRGESGAALKLVNLIKQQIELC